MVGWQMRNFFLLLFELDVHRRQFLIDIRQMNASTVKKGDIGHVQYESSDSFKNQEGVREKQIEDDI